MEELEVVDVERLRTFNASMIEKVEVINNPSAKYDPDGVGGIINIVMKRGALDGFNGNVSAMQVTISNKT